MIITAEQLRRVAGVKPSQKKAMGIVTATANAIDEHAAKFGIDKPHILAHFIAQIAHESARFRTTIEYASGAAYEGRRDLGNIHKGDGRRFRGHGLIQVTGRANHRDFTKWCMVAQSVPFVLDFEAEPDKLSEFPWAFLGAVWYWQTRKLTGYAKQNQIKRITRLINGGYNGLEDRINLYVRAALVLLGYELKKGVIRKFQTDVGLKADDVAGPETRAALHSALAKLAGNMRPRGVTWVEEEPTKTGKKVGIGAALVAAAAGVAAWASSYWPSEWWPF